MKQNSIRRLVDRAILFVVMPVLILVNFGVHRMVRPSQSKKVNLGKALDSLVIYVLLPIMLLLVLSYSHAAEMTVVDEIAVAAENTARQVLQQPGVELTVDAKIDERVSMPACDHELETRVHSRTASAMSVAVHCRRPQPWTLYVPVRAERKAEVLVLASNLAAGTVLGAEHVTTQKRDIGSLAYGYMTHAGEVIGKHLRRPLQAGWVLSSQDVESPRLIKRGDTVTLIARSGPVEVRAEGKALSNAGAEERIRVENMSTRRVVDGTVTADGLVNVGR